ncbi:MULTISPECIES: PadR family transcriptional regulator [unclassified Micromonospora]|uniref:PadR family transcriptional regulator n=1 Tax=unclassified Micromonospora TaxID=2617518 RepID=UPI003A8463EA
MPRRPNSSQQTLRIFACFLAAPDDWRYGYQLSKETGLASGSLYPILMRLTEQRLLEAQWREPASPGRPPRHVYRLTTDGAALARTRLAEAQHNEAANAQSRRRATGHTAPAPRPTIQEA